MVKRLGNNIYTKPPEPGHKNNDGPRWPVLVGKYLAVTTQNMAMVGICTVIGWYLDRTLNSGPFLMIAGVFVGAGTGLYHLVRFVDSDRNKIDD